MISTFPKPHEGYGYHLNGPTVPLENGTMVNAYKAHRACLKGGALGKELCQRSTYPSELYEDDWTAANAVTLLERAPHDKPWFLWVSFPGPHPPFAVTADMAASVAGRTWPTAVDSNNRSVACDPAGGEPSQAHVRCNYAAEMENLDRLFGVVLEAATARGNSIESDTVVCFFSDHGEMLNDHNDWDKSKPWQGALNVPLVCAGPTVRKNVSIEVSMATIDIGATVLDFAGAAAHPGMTAQSFRGLLEGADPTRRNRTVVLSGLQSYDFGHAPAPAGADADNEEDAAAAAFNFRVAVADFEGVPYKFVCCRGKCPGSPSTAPKPDTDGYTRLLYNTQADPFDMSDIKAMHPKKVVALSGALPVANGFNCSSGRA